ncbi:MAG: amidase [Alphaproteobacteria bacterium]
MSDDLAYTSATDLLIAYRAKTLSPVEATRAALARIDAHDELLNAYLLVDHDGALAAARESEARWAKGEPRGLVDGVPTSIKDVLLTKGWPTLRGSRTVDRDQPWDDDAPSVARMRDHGAVFLGKTTTPEFGHKGVTDSPLSGITRNPWNTERTSGGSSGGASSAVAAGMGPLAFGTDAGGSIRIPAGFTGVFGHKPSFGRVPAWPASPFSTLAHVGPMTRTVADAALMLTVISEPDARDWFALPFEARDYRDGLYGGVEGLRIAFSPDLGYAPVDDDIAASVASAAQVFSDLGAEVEQVNPGFDDPTQAFRTLAWAGLAHALGNQPDEQLALMDPSVAGLIEFGRAVSRDEYLDAVAVRIALGSHMTAFHQRYDLLLTPTLPIPAFEVGLYMPEGDDLRQWIDWSPFSYPINMTQQPAASIPCGFTMGGLPIGLQIIGPMHRDDMVLRAAQAYEQINPVGQERPAL